jgi:hypothetical protein
METGEYLLQNPTYASRAQRRSFIKSPPTKSRKTTTRAPMDMKNSV